MKTQRTWQYLTLATLLSIWGCTSTKQVAQSNGEVDDLYASSTNAVVFADSRQQYTEQATDRSSQTQRQRSSITQNPEYTDEKLSYNQNQDEYYTELSARKLQRGISADPGWNSTNDYNAGFVNGYNAGSLAYNSLSWNRWGYNNPFNTGFGLGLGIGSGFGWNNWGMNRFGYGFGGYDPFYGGFNSYAYNPWGYGYGSYGFGGYDPFYGGYNSWGYGGSWGRPVIVNNNVIVTGADPYRNYRSSGARSGSSTGRYNDGFVNTPPAYNPNGGRSASGTSRPAYTNSGSSSGNGNYASPRQNSRGNSYYYENSASTSGGRTSSGNSTPSYSSPSTSGSSSDYYARPRQNSRGSSYTPPSSDYSSGSGRTSTPTYSAPSYQSRSYDTQSTPSRSYESPSYQSRSSQPSYSAPAQQSTPSYNSGGSRGGSSSGTSSGGSSSGGGSRGPR